MGVELFQAEGQRDMEILIVSKTILPRCLKSTKGMRVSTMPHLSKVSLLYNLKIHSDNRIKEPKTRKACCIHGTAEKFNNISIRNYARAIRIGR